MQQLSAGQNSSTPSVSLFVSVIALNSIKIKCFWVPKTQSDFEYEDFNQLKVNKYLGHKHIARFRWLRKTHTPVLPANFYINVQQMLHNYICCNIKAQQMLQFVLFDLWRFGSKCWTIYIDYKHSVAAAFIMAPIACWISFFRIF